MPLLAGILLGHLQLNRFIWIVQAGEKRGHGLTHLEIHRSVLGLDADVIVKFAVEGEEVVPGSVGTTTFVLTPRAVPAVDKSSVEQNDTVWRKRSSDYV